MYSLCQKSYKQTGYFQVYLGRRCCTYVTITNMRIEKLGWISSQISTANTLEVGPAKIRI